MASFYVGTWASRNAEVFPDPNAEYFTSVLYPIIFDDGLTANASSITSGYILESTTDSMSLASPAIVSGTITPTIVYQTYDHLRVEQLEAGVPTITAGTITTVISYVDYNNWPTEQLQLGTPTIQSGEIL